LSLVSLSNAHFDYGREHILRGVNVALHPGVKYALVGANGAGKTTLLAAISGQLQLQGGTRQAMGSVQIRLLRQETSLDPHQTGDRRLLEVVAGSAFARERELEEELAAVARRLELADAGEHDQLVEQQGRLQAEFERLDGYSVQARLESALHGVGLPDETWDRPVEQLSGGERRRAALAAELLSGAELLLLDEPTNHLDLESCEWLEGYLDQYPGAVVIVSHDRHFLDRVARKTLHLDRGRLVSYSGNYSFFDEQSRLRYEQELAAWQRQQTKIKQTEEYIRRNIEGQKTKQAQARRKQMAKEEKLERPTAEPGLFRFHLQPVRPSGGTVLQAETLGKGFGERVLLRDLDLHVSRGERIGIVGPNGCGKSTLLKMMAGKVVPDTGRVVTGHNVDLGFYDQELASVSDHNTVVAEMASVDPAATLGELRSFLGAFGFGEDLFDRPVGQLSGGERGRLALLRLIKEGHNTLLLDEPTNHLDIRSRESLEAALAEYTGTLIVVSHDRRFLDKIIDKLLVFPPADQAVRAGGQVTVHLGNYADFVRSREQRRQEAAAGTRTPSPRSQAPGAGAEPAGAGRTALSKNEQQRRQNWIDEAEEKILALETEKEDILQEMTRPDLANERRAELGRRITAIETELAGHMADWEQWNLEIEEGI
jgi:ATP-binding cassette subfamily F protein 3